MNNLKLYKLIALGHLIINIPALLISFGLPLLTIFLFDNIIVKIILSIIAFILGITFSWLLWSVLVTKWRIWAFNQVQEDDWYRLKELAIVNKLIWDDGSIFESTEKRSDQENRQINDISKRIAEYGQIEDIKLDLGTAEELRFKLNKREIILESISKCFLILVVIGLFLTKQIIFGLILLVLILSIGNSYKVINQVFDNKDYLVINSKGIELYISKHQFINWNEIDKILLNIEKKKLIIIKVENNRAIKIDFNLWQLNIKDYRKFQRQLKVFIDRFHYKQTRQNE